jgi:hypothetical protein
MAPSISVVGGRHTVGVMPRRSVLCPSSLHSPATPGRGGDEEILTKREWRRGTMIAFGGGMALDNADVTSMSHPLPGDVRVDDVVRRTRHAASAFLGSATLRWGRSKLRSWLIIEYGMATEWTREGDATSALESVSRMDEARVRSLVEEVRKRVTAMVTEAPRAWTYPAFAENAVSRRLVTTLTDVAGRVVYAPVARPELGLLERVGSLFVADFLMHPTEYDRVTSCESCGEILFHQRLRHSRACVRQSGMRPRVESGISLRESIVTSASACAVTPLHPSRRASYPRA